MNYMPYSAQVGQGFNFDAFTQGLLGGFDAQASLGFLISQTSHIEAGVYEIEYGDIQYQDLIPVDTSAHPFAKSVTYYSMDKFGAAKWINGNADDIPMVSSEMSKYETPVYTAGVGYGWGFEEIGYAMRMGVNLQDIDARTARRAYEEMVDRVALQGDAEKNFDGLIDNAGVTAVAAPVGDWGGTGTDYLTVLGDVNAALSGIATLVLWKGTRIADTLLLPYEKLMYLSEVLLPGTTTTLLAHIMANNVLTALYGKKLTIRAIRGLETAGAGGTARMVAYRRDPEVLKMHIPMPFRFLPVWQSGPLRWYVPGVFRLGGLDIRLPGEVRYVDGI